MERTRRTQLRRGTRIVSLMAAAVMVVALVPGSALAYHPTGDIKVGKDYLNNNANRFHPGDRTMYVGQTATFTFAAGAHNVDQASAPAGATSFRSPNAGAGNSEAVGSTWTYAFAQPGTYWCFCNIHAGAGDTPTTFDANGEPANGKMVGRVVVQNDTTGPAWGAGGPTASAVSASQIDLTWPAATDAETGIQTYRVYEATGATRPAKPATPAATPTATSLSRSGLTSGTHYWYWVTAVNGAGTPSSSDQLMDATTSSVAASATATGVVKFAVSTTLAISVTPDVLDLGVVSPAAAAAGVQTVNVKSNDTWSLSVKAVGRDGVDGAPGDDASFTGAGGSTIPIGRLTWKVGAAAPAPMSDASASVLSGQPATSSAGTDSIVDLSLQILYSDPVALDYQTVVLYTATQP